MKTGRLFAAAALWVMLYSISFGYSGGDGSAGNPYQIASKADLLTLGATTADYSYCFILTADIDLAGESFTRAVIAPDPDSATFSFQGTYFKGVFDGNGHMIRNLKIAGAGNDFVGLFGYAYSGQIKNLGLENVDIQGRDYIGGLVGFQLYTVITSCYVSGSVNATGYCVGGLVGCNSSGCTITNCYETGTVSGAWSGGLVGINYGPITSCYATGDVSGSSVLGGLVAQGDSSLITAGFWDTETSHQAASAGGTGKTTVEMKTQTTFTDAGWDFSAVWFMPMNSYPRLAWEKRYTGGKGTAEDPYQITSIADWQKLMITTADWNKCFILMADINLSGVPVTPVGNDSTTFTGTFDGNGHTVSNATISLSSTSNIGLFGNIGNSRIQNLGVTGITVSGFYDVGGLAGSSYNSTIAACYVTGSVSGKGTVGGLIGYNYGGTIISCHTSGSVASTGGDIGGLVGENSSSVAVTLCYTTGTVVGTTIGGFSGSSSGGLIGVNSGAITSCYATGPVTNSDYAGGLIGTNRGTITSCYATGAVTTSKTAGGLTGYNYASSTMISCYAAGTVKGDSNAGGLTGSNNGIITCCYATGAAGNAGTSLCVGGLTGYNGGTITSCYAAGTASGTWMIGGLTGQNEGTVTASYAIGKVTVTAYYGYAGGLAGYNTGSIAANNFWDINTSGQSGSAGGTGKTTTQMWTLSTYTDAGWDFSADDGDAADWQMPAPYYPRLSWESLLYSGGRGSANEPYCIASISDWQTLMTTKSDWSKCFVLAADLNMSGIALTPIGNESTSFTGTFNGNGHTISNITINTPGSRTVGLFGYISNGGMIKNLHAENVTLRGGWFVGLIGDAWINSQIYNVSAENVNIQGDYYVGAVAGYNYGQMSYCGATGIVNGNQCVGGLTGWNWGTITLCYAACSVGSTWNTYIGGGLVGHNGSTIASCYAKGTVNAFNSAGGLAGSNDGGGTITMCYAACDINCYSNVGGFIGNNTNGTSGKITSCFWDTGISGMSQAVGSGPATGITGKTTTEMKTLLTFTSAGWDFTIIWAICEGTNYPRLKWQIPVGDWVCPDGVNTEDLDYFVGRWLFDNCTSGNNYCGGADVDRSGAVNLADYAILAEHWLEGV